ncbi:hypothetical protein KR054_011974 [Drosophila jambulina]|nr:hypothetical protein KR054_011974 [Drosophila jambulina]
MSQNPKIVSGTKLEEYVVCPYDSVHRLLPSRLAVHLIRCARNYPSAQKVMCPYNVTHVYSVAEMTTHVERCPNRPIQGHLKDSVKLPPAEEPRSSTFCVESSEDWDAEPPADTYDPYARCESDFVIRNPQGKAPAERREFRARERRRFIENNKF